MKAVLREESSQSNVEGFVKQEGLNQKWKNEVMIEGKCGKSTEIDSELERLGWGWHKHWEL